MLQILIGQTDAVRGFVGERVGCRDFGPSEALGVVLDGELIAGVVYNEHRDFDLKMHIAAASPRWASRRTIDKLLGYPFRQLKCVRVTAVVPRGNHQARNLLQKLGFKMEGTHKFGWDGRQTAISYGLTRKMAAKWIGEENGHG
jgi:RimJ/RimL family protein N-acetyltransferase